MQKKMLDYIRRQDLLRPGDRVIAGVSGGADSVCLLCLLAELREELGIELKAVHIHHGLRGAEADRDARYAEGLAADLGVPFVMARVDVTSRAEKMKLSEEEAARELRYGELYRQMEIWGGNKIAVAHHRDDNVETVLHNLFRGSGLKGIGGMAPVRGVIVRPLLWCSREEILAYLEKRQISYCEDSSNASSCYTRNRIRNSLLPMIESEINRGARENILRAAKLASQADAYLEQEADRILKEAGTEEEGGVGISLSVFREQQEIIRTYLALLMMKKACGSGRDFTSAHVEAVAGLADKAVGSLADLPWGLEAVKTYGELRIRPKNRETKETRGESVLPQLVYDIIPYKKGQEIPKNQYTKWFDYDKIKGILSVRHRTPGDYLTLSGGGTKTVKSYMIDEKIPRERRNEIPLLAEGNHVLWVIGHRISEYYKITDDTVRVLQVQLNGGKSDGGQDTRTVAGGDCGSED